MNKQEFLKINDSQQKRISEKYGVFMYFMISNLFNVNTLSKIVEEKGYKTERITIHGTAYDEIYHNNKRIGRIECVGSYPQIIFEKRCRQHAKKFAEYAITPIKGVHRILDWHDVKENKLHCLARGETVLHFQSPDISNEKIDKFIKDLKLESIVEYSLNLKIDNLKI